MLSSCSYKKYKMSVPEEKALVPEEEPQDEFPLNQEQLQELLTSESSLLDVCMFLNEPPVFELVQQRTLICAPSSTPTTFTRCSNTARC